jgi:carbon starvation protein
LLRFNVEEIFRSLELDALANRYVASFIAVLGIAGFALVPGSKTLWVLFGTTNQLLAGLTLVTVSLFLFKLGRPMIYTLVPMALMLTMTIWAMFFKLGEFYSEEKWALFGFSLVILAMSFWLLAEAVLSFRRGRGGLTIDDAGPTAAELKAEEVSAATHLG